MTKFTKAIRQQLLTISEDQYLSICIDDYQENVDYNADEDVAGAFKFIANNQELSIRSTALSRQQTIALINRAITDGWASHYDDRDFEVTVSLEDCI